MKPDDSSGALYTRAHPVCCSCRAGSRWKGFTSQGFRTVPHSALESVLSLWPEARFISSAAAPGQFVGDQGVEIAFSGRSNAGKSSAINRILGRRSLARTSKDPGRTRLVNFFHLAEDSRLVDLPGYGYAKVSKTMRRDWQVLMDAYFRRRRSLLGMVLVVDCRRGLGDTDLQMLDYASALGVPAHVLLSKSDKLKRGAANEALLGARKALKSRADVQLFSAKSGQGLEEARTRLVTMLEAGRAKASHEGDG